MELVKVHVNKSKPIVIAPLGDIQWSGKTGPTALNHLKRYIERALELDALFVGMGDYIDFASPSNRQRLKSAGLYDTAQDVIEDAAVRLVEEIYEEALKPTKGRWIGLLEGHHFTELAGETTDSRLAQKLGTQQLGTSAYIHLAPIGVTICCHHGLGNGMLPGVGLNKLYHWSAGLAGADVYLIGHNTKLATTRLSRPYPVWSPKPELIHKDVLLVNTGGFSKSSIVGHRRNSVPRGDYAESGMMTPAPLSAPLITIDPKASGPERIRVEI